MFFRNEAKYKFLLMLDDKKSTLHSLDRRLGGVVAHLDIPAHLIVAKNLLRLKLLVLISPNGFS